MIRSLYAPRLDPLKLDPPPPRPEFRNTQFSYSMGLNQAPPAPFRESVRLAEQNLYSRASDLVGDRNPREHEFVVQLRSFDSGKSGADLGVAVLIALCSALLGRSLKGGLAIVDGLNLGGSVELVHNRIEVMELAKEKGAGMVRLPVSSRRALVDLSDDVAAGPISVLSRRRGRLAEGIERRLRVHRT